jgi:prolyl-tRNA editing enzyme YbaK/EbsC (Cys-tRNA(Pro) deacylase)
MRDCSGRLPGARAESIFVADDVPSRIRQWLRSAGVVFREVEHEPTHTSEESARARGEELKIGGKAMVLKFEETFCVFVLSAARKLDSTAIRHRFGVRHLRFATPDELFEMTGLTPGAVPPFGKPVLPFDLYVDQSIVENERIAFNAGAHTLSIIMRVDDYLRLTRPTVFSFSR